MKNQNRNAILLVILILLLTAITNRCTAQSQINLQAGYKALSLGYTYQNEDFLNFGVSASVVESRIVEKRANRNDTSKKVHDFNSDVVPALFGEIGATFDKFTITGKLGAAYLNQSINNIQENQKLYYAVGVRFEYEINDSVGIIGSWDNVNSGMVGVSLKLQ